MEKVSADIFTFQHPCRKCCLTIAGSDSGGNAGVQADLRAFHYYGRHGCTVFAALTAQNPFGVSAIHAVPADFVAAQLDAVLGVYDIGAVKTGMLADPAAIEVIADRLAKHPEIAKVIDPVMVATSGVRLVSEETVEKIKGLLLPLATLITPNLPEAEVLLGNAVDVLFDGSAISSYTLPWVDHPVSTHGTGCSLGAALAAEQTAGKSLADAVAGAKAYVHGAIANSYWVGTNCGVLGIPET